MKAVLMSIKPYYVFRIIARTMGWKVEQEKTVEVRKNFPQVKDWDKKSLIYCSRDRLSFNRIPKEYRPLMAPLLGKVIGEFVCDKIYEIGTYWATDEIYSAYSDEMEDELREEGLDISDFTCLTEKEIIEYLGANRDGYGWHISALKIYDKPKKLGEFRVVDENAVKNCEYRERIYINPDFVNGAHIKGGYICAKDKINANWCEKCLSKPITRPPQSYMYVEEL